ncbi:hypothetical protein C882_3020 [Caenispirillum salinarum AK4]|uniref:Membrane-anchored protein n=1 Tax=Caenispirillum salinarum AK4 TaxID=1238182 RepID=K9HUM2_9PROT|nr:DUF3422 domain-containing protein [Caenispirillum salinarum]EKV31956.1 hypothetical protein C882_3020 [Caenispirillum salinarum AK4]
MPDTAAAVLSEHPLRAMLSNEVHARPHEQLEGPWRATHFAMLSGERGSQEDRDLLTGLLADHGLPAAPEGAVYHSVDLGPVRLRWERHTEFSTWTFLLPGAFDPAAPFAQTALDAVPEAWLRRLPGQLLVAMHVVMDARERGLDELAELFGSRVSGSRVGGGAGAVYTDFLLRGDGFGRALIVNRRLTPGQSGRTLQRLLEIETYRMMALLTFPQARETGPRLSRIEQGLAEVTAELAESNGGADRDRRLLGRLTEYAAETERLLAALNFRLSASRAYHAIVRRAVADLREERIEGLQTFAEFLARRLSPAMNTCEYVGERMETLSKRLTRAGDMLRTRVDIALGENNRDLLHSMNRRAELQLRLQETVEGLSVVAISYYLLGLVGYAAKGLKEVGLLPVDPAVAVLAGLPVVVALVLVGVRRLRKAVTKRGH